MKPQKLIKLEFRVSEIPSSIVNYPLSKSSLPLTPMLQKEHILNKIYTLNKKNYLSAKLKIINYVRIS